MRCGGSFTFSITGAHTATMSLYLLDMNQFQAGRVSQDGTQHEGRRVLLIYDPVKSAKYEIIIFVGPARGKI